MGMTFAQKVLAAKAGLPHVAVSQIVEVEPDFCMSHDNTSAIAKTFKKLGVKRVKNPEKFVIVLDHTVPAAEEKYAQNHKEVREFITEQGIENFYDMGIGICHQVLSEKGYALPGALILGSDSHTTTYGGLGAFAAGVGRSEMAVLYATSRIWLKTPASFKMILHGRLKEPAITSKDMILRIIGDIGADGALYKSVEFSGTAIDQMSISSRLVLANMAIEMGAKNGFIAPDAKAMDFLAGRAQRPFTPVFPDPDAEYEKVLEWDASTLEPMVACPHTVDNVKPISAVEGTPIQQCLLGTCTNGRIEDFRIAAEILKGHKVKKGVRLLMFPASQAVLVAALKEGLMDTLVEAGGILMSPGCGPCLGAHQGVLAPGETCISTSNRNFQGRMGSNEAQVYLASPASVAAAAIEGTIVDPRRFVS